MKQEEMVDELRSKFVPIILEFLKKYNGDPAVGTVVSGTLADLYVTYSVNEFMSLGLGIQDIITQLTMELSAVILSVPERIDTINNTVEDTLRKKKQD